MVAVGRLASLWSLLAVTAMAPATASADRPREGLDGEPQLHPLDTFTADTLRAGEWFYAQSPNTFPLPSWAFVGVTDRLTVEIDLLPLIGGFFVEPHLPVPSVDVRYRLLERRGDRPGIALESMVQYLYGTNEQIHGERVKVTREGVSWFARLNVSQSIGPDVTIHASAGATFAQAIAIENVLEGAAYRGRSFHRLISPDASFGISWAVAPWLGLHAAASYGTTFTYLDNVPRKLQATYGARVAPFYRSARGWLRSLRIELASINMRFRDADEDLSIAVPIWPYLYWQWGG
jgi:hypothetical protein